MKSTLSLARERPWQLPPLLAVGLGAAEFCATVALMVPIARAYGITDALWVTVWVCAPLVGAVTASLRPRHPVGWLLLAIGGLGVASQFGYAYSVGPAYPAAASLLSVPQAFVFIAASALLISAVVLVAILILVFPTGSLGRGWRRRTVGAVAVVYVLSLIPSVFVRQLSGDANTYANPLTPRGLGGLFSTLTGVFSVTLALIFLGVALDAVLRLRRSRGIQHQQMKWLAYASALLVPALVIAVAFSAWWSVIPLLVASNGLAASIGLALVRYRLYEIDRIISRTLSYAIVTGLLVCVYVGLVTLTTRVLPFSSPLGVAASTLVAVALFNPLRRRVQRLVDRRFNRARYNAEATVSAFAQRVRDDVDLEVVSSEFVRAVQASVEPAHVSLWLRPTGSSS